MVISIGTGDENISIHALLAESDPLAFWYSRCSR